MLFHYYSIYICIHHLLRHKKILGDVGRDLIYKENIDPDEHPVIA